MTKNSASRTRNCFQEKFKSLLLLLLDWFIVQHLDLLSIVNLELFCQKCSCKFNDIILRLQKSQKVLQKNF